MRPPRRQDYLDGFHAAVLGGRLPAGRFLEIACGGGGLSRRLARMGLRPVALDLHAQTCAGEGGARFLCGDAARLPFRDGSFRAVLAVHAFDTLARSEILAAAFREAARVLEVGGTLFAIENRGRRTSRLPVGDLAAVAGLSQEGCLRIRGRKGILHACVSAGAVPSRLLPLLARGEQAFSRLRPAAPGAYLFAFRK